MNIILLLATAYLLGSVPFGFLIARTAGQLDIRKHGSGNIGARNVGRVLGLKYAWLVFLLDFSKGFIPVMFSYLFGAISKPYLPLAAGLLAVLGHNWSIFLSFDGGKGVSTSLGAIAALLIFFLDPSLFNIHLVYIAGLLALMAARHRPKE